MKKYLILLTLPMLFTLSNCKNKSECCPQEQDKCGTQTEKVVKETNIKTSIKSLIDKYGETNKFRIEKGVNQVAAFWNSADGSAEDFEKYCIENFINSDGELDTVFQKLSTNLEALYGNFNKISIELKKNLHLDMGPLHKVDEMFGGYEPSANMSANFFENKIAFYTLLNFPFYSLKEKEELGSKWTRKEWAYARMGDLFTARIPASLVQKYSEATTSSDTYISEYNIYMGNLVDAQNKTYFPKDMKLITHWGLRDELKSNYNSKDGLLKQKIIYNVMKNIITQEIPENVINSDKLQWNPETNKVFENGKEIKFKPEPNIRYQHLLNIFKASKEMDQYSPLYSDNIKRSFEQGMELSQENVEKMFIEFVSSPQVKKVAALISKRLGRNLEPFDIWYDGFKSRSTINEDELTALTRKKYPTREAFQKDLPNILVKLGFTSEKANSISSKISVDPARGAGHAWGAEMKSDVAHLRTRIGKEGMDYKGYNIAVHEFGHNVEQTITLQDIDYYMLKGVPTTAFTEAIAFTFQKRDLELLGYSPKNKDNSQEYLEAIDNFWMSYEIMGVALVDMNIWKWMYANPEATPEELKNTMVTISKDIWNKYYADVFGIKDQPILAIYSHIIDAPLYVSAYPVGHLIEFQISQYIKNKPFASELQRILLNGRIIPQEWMKKAVGNSISIKPTIDATEEALKNLK